MPLVVRPGMTEEIPLERAHSLGGEGKVVPKRERPAVKSPPADMGLEGPGEPHFKMEQTNVDGFSLADCTMI